MKKSTTLIFIIPIIILILIGISYNYLNRKTDILEITSLSNIEIYKFNSYSKFSSDKIDVLTDEEKLSKFKTIINSYIIFSGWNTTYVLDENYTKTLKEIFKNAKHQHLC